MQKDILLYGSIDSWSSREFIQAIIDSGAEDITARINSPGGDVQYGWGIIAKLSEAAGKLILKNDGKAHSMAAFMFCYATEAEAVDTAEFIFHRAAYASWIESDPDFFDDETQAALARINKSLRAALESKIDVPAFEALKGVKMKDLFSLEGRIEVTLTAAEAKSIGLINRVVKITPKKKSEISALMREITAKHTGLPIAANTDDNSKNKNMTIEKLKAEFPAVYAAVVAVGVTEGVAKEKDRVGSFLAFVELDPKAVKEAINSGKVMTETERSEFAVKAFSAKALKDTTEDTETDPLKTKEEKEALAKTEKEKEVAAFSAEVDKRLGLKPATV